METQVQPTIESMGEVFCDVLEKFAFLFGEPCQMDEIPEVDGELVTVSMKFAGDYSGLLMLAVPRKIGLDIAANALGVDPDDDTALRRSEDALKELLNLTCGHLLTSSVGSKPVMDLSVPEVSLMDGDEWNEMIANERTALFLIDDSPALLRFEIHE